MEITQLLQRIGAGDAAAEQELIPLVYSELKRLASGHLRGGRNVTLNVTSLVHEAFLRMAVSGGPQPKFEDRAHFFGVASRLMRNVIVDAWRQANAQKRDAGLTVQIEDIGEIGASGREAVLLDLDAALDRLGTEFPGPAKMVEMRYFAGMTLEEIAAASSVSVSTAQRDLRYAQAWLRRALAPSGSA
jgi:RNA polymerase sigma factor (TIGR02999 family)